MDQSEIVADTSLLEINDKTSPVQKNSKQHEGTCSAGNQRLDFTAIKGK